MSAFAFQREQLVRFGHCDPAGIVFYPRYFEMLNELIEDWFAHALGLPFDVLIGQRGVGMPTAQLDTRFLRVSRHGDRLIQAIRIERLEKVVIRGVAGCFTVLDPKQLQGFRLEAAPPAKDGDQIIRASQHGRNRDAENGP